MPLKLSLLRSAVLAVCTIVGSAYGTTATDSDIAAFLNSTSDLAAFGSLLSRFPDLLAEIQNTSAYTVFAPNDAAFAALPRTSSWQSALSSSSSNYLEALLRYHILGERVYESQFSTTPQFLHTLLNSSQYCDVSQGQVVELRRQGANASVISGLRQTASIVTPNLNVSSNGIVHIIDSFLQVPLDVSTTATAANLTSLAGALSSTNLAGSIDNTSDVTIFAPSNQAFQNIANIASAWSTAQLSSVLSYHMVPNALGYTSLLANSTDVSTLAGPGLNVTLIGGAVFVNAARVVLADILIEGGVLHIIDAVLNPNSTQTIDSAATIAPVLWSGATAASSALYTSGQPTPSSTNAALTATTDMVVAGYSTRPTAMITTSTKAASSASSSAGAVMPTGAIGAAALFGGAAVFIQL